MFNNHEVVLDLMLTKVQNRQIVRTMLIFFFRYQFVDSTPVNGRGASLIDIVAGGYIAELPK